MIRVFLGIGALLAAGAANAQSRSGSNSKVYFAQETVASAGATTVGGETYYPFRFATGEGYVRRSPLAILANLPYFLRVEMENMRVAQGTMLLTHAVSRPTLTACIPSFIPAGGIAPARYAEHGTVAIYRFESSTTLAANHCLRFALQDSGLKLQATGGHIRLKVRLYDTLSGAVNANEANLLGESASGGVADFLPTVTARAVPLATATASVERGFAAFAGASPNKADLASIRLLTTHANRQIHVGGTVNPDNTFTGGMPEDFEYVDAQTGADMTAAAAKALVRSAKVYVKSDRGDLSTGKFKLSAGTGATGCPAADLAPVASGDRAGQLMGALTGATGEETLEVVVGHFIFPRVRERYGAGPGCVLSMDVAANAKLEAENGDFKAILAQKFTVDMEVTLAGSVPARFARPGLAGAAAGEIERDGTTVQLPYLTTRPGYMHKVVLTNRGTKAADFWIESVSSSDGTGATSKVTASTPMSVGPASRASVAAGDLVDFGAGGTQGAATLSVNAARANVSVATVLTNLASNSTDTLSLVEPAADTAAPTR